MTGAVRHRPLTKICEIRFRVVSERASDGSCPGHKPRQEPEVDTY